MEVNFFKDLETEIKEKLKDFGYPIPSFAELRKQHISATEAHLSYKHYDIKNLVLHFLTVTERRIPIKKWNIHISPQLQNRTEIVNIVSMLSKGEDANSLLSHRIRSRHQNDEHSHDLLRYEWGIYHLHFTKKRSKNLLFVFIHHDDIYLIDILAHESKKLGNVTWTNTDLIQTLHDNWPHVIARAIFKTDSKESLTTEQRQILRNKAANTNVTVRDGTEYMPIGGGFSCSKHPQKAAKNTLRMLKRTEELESMVLNNNNNIKNLLLIDKSSKNIKIKLELTDGLNLKVINTANKSSFEIDEPY